MSGSAQSETKRNDIKVVEDNGLKIESQDTSRRMIYASEELRSPLLDGDDIRLVHISREPTTDLNLLQLQTISLEKAPAYNALSYTWGPPSTNPEHRLQGYLFTENLVDCVNHISSKLPGLWWIDAICIVQDDLQEKRHQVKKMRDIYARAQKVHVWLSPDNDDNFLGLQIFCRIYNHVCASNSVIPKKSSEIRFHDVESEHLGLPANRKGPAWIALMKFLSHPYFRRIWILQELAAAREDASFICGPMTLPYRFFYHTITWIDTQGMKDSLYSLAGQLELSFDFGAFDFIKTVTALRVWPTMLRVKFDLSACITMCISFKSTDPRDRIIALLGLVSPEDEATKKIEPDYDRPVADFFRDVTGTAIMSYRSYVPLSLGALRPETTLTNLPSWVPDYSSDVNAYYAEIYHASDSTPFAAEWKLGSNTLSVLAKIVDKVDIVSDNGVRPWTSIDSHVISWLAMAAKTAKLDMWEWLSSPGVTQSPIDPWFDSFWRTMIGNRKQEGDDDDDDDLGPEAPDEYRWRFLTYIMDILIKHDKDRTIKMVATWSTRIDIETLILAPLREGTHDVFSQGLIKTALYKRFLITKQGRLGLGPTSLQPGDSVTLLSGGRPIYFLHGQQPHHEFLGDGYVHGLMNGEGLRDDPSFQHVDIQ